MFGFNIAFSLQTIHRVIYMDKNVAITSKLLVWVLEAWSCLLTIKKDTHLKLFLRIYLKNSKNYGKIRKRSFKYTCQKIDLFEKILKK